MPILDRLARGLHTSKPEETAELAREIARALPPDAILALQGDLGVGKTTLVQGLAAAWGIQGPVKSPTYNLISIHEGDRQLVHVDAYRLESPDALEGLMIDEFLRSPFCLVVEWPERIREALPPDTFWIQIAIERDHRRRFQLLAPATAAR